jgi:hypothetical protein
LSTHPGMQVVISMFESNWGMYSWQTAINRRALQAIAGSSNTGDQDWKGGVVVAQQLLCIGECSLWGVIWSAWLILGAFYLSICEEINYSELEVFSFHYLLCLQPATR